MEIYYKIMICPHCSMGFHPTPYEEGPIGKDKDGQWFFYKVNCPECQKIIIILKLCRGLASDTLPSQNPSHYTEKKILVYPKETRNRPPCPQEVEAKYRNDYDEACLVLKDSSKASAALSRRCLQLLLRDKVGVPKGNLQSEIEAAITKENYPSTISDLLHALQWVGNFSVHPEKDTNTNEIIEVEEGEADLCLEIFEALFDFHFVLPAKHQKMLTSISEKLQRSGKNIKL